MDARLRVLSGPHAGETIEVRRGKLLIGREEDCHLRPESEFVSRHHCVLLLDEYALRIRDLGSKNGTFVNGRRVGAGETILLHDDMISIGEMIGQIDLAQAEAALARVDASSTETQREVALLGTGFFDGDTVQTDAPPALPTETHASQEKPMSLIPNVLPAGTEDDGDTKTVFPPSE
jgi:pSer/pThr/pTyr-binding forkhead associated (FHA) protein